MALWSHEIPPFYTNFYYLSEFISNYSRIYEVTLWKLIKKNYYQKKILPNKNYETSVSSAFSFKKFHNTSGCIMVLNI